MTRSTGKTRTNRHPFTPFQPAELDPNTLWRVLSNNEINSAFWSHPSSGDVNPLHLVRVKIPRWDKKTDPADAWWRYEASKMVEAFIAWSGADSDRTFRLILVEPGVTLQLVTGTSEESRLKELPRRSRIVALLDATSLRFERMTQ